MCIDKQPGKGRKANKNKSSNKVGDNYEPPAKQPRRQPKKARLPVEPRVQRPRRSCTKPELTQEPKMPVRKSCIEISPEDENDNAERSSRRFSTKKRVSETQVTNATEEVFKSNSVSAKKKNQLLHIAKNYDSKQHATYKGQKEAAYKKTNESSQDTSFDCLMQSIALPKMVKLDKKAAGAEADPRKIVKEPMLFDEYDFEQQEEFDSSRMDKKTSKPQKGNKLNLKLEKRVPAKEASVRKSKIIYFLLYIFRPFYII